MLGKDLCDMSGAKGRSPDAYTVYNVMLPRKYHPAIQNNLFEKRTKVRNVTLVHNNACYLHAGNSATAARWIHGRWYDAASQSAA